jgi:hypothetical protein
MCLLLARAAVAVPKAAVAVAVALSFRKPLCIYPLEVTQQPSEVAALVAQREIVARAATAPTSMASMPLVAVAARAVAETLGLFQLAEPLVMAAAVAAVSAERSTLAATRC